MIQKQLKIKENEGKKQLKLKQWKVENTIESKEEYY